MSVALLGKTAMASVVVFLLLAAGFSAVPTVAPEVAARTYDFRNNINNKAYEGTDPDVPPLGQEIGRELSPKEYAQIVGLDGQMAEYSGYSEYHTRYSDYHRFRFRLLEPRDTISQIYVEHHGYGISEYFWHYLHDIWGLRLFIWNQWTSSWEWMDAHWEGNSNGVLSGTIGKSSSYAYVDADGYLNVLVQAEDAIGSCPFLYAYYGGVYDFVADLYNRGILAVPNFPSQPEDYVKINNNQLQVDGSYYRLRIAQEYDEISYLDQVSLMTLNHSPDTDVYMSLLKADVDGVYTVSKHLTSPVSATNQYGEDVLRQIDQKDGVYLRGPKNELKILNLGLGDLSGAEHVKLVISGYTIWTNDKVENLDRFVEVKDENGDWATVYENFEIITPSALPRTYVLDLTGKFPSNDYSIRIGYYPDVRVDFVAIDTSSPEDVQIERLDPVYADLHFRGYSQMPGVPAIPDYYAVRPEPPGGYSHPTGNFTRFGDVLPLLTSRDDKFVILRHGDEVSVSFAQSPVSEGLERDFMLYSWGYYKGRAYETGGTVEPLPFRGMSTYPYPSSEDYPFDNDHLAYLREYNTRVYPQNEFDHEGSTRQLGGHHTIYTDYVKVDVWTGTPPTTTTATHTVGLTTTGSTTSIVEVAVTGVVGEISTATVTRMITTMVTATLTVEKSVIPLPFQSLIGFVAIICGLYVIRKIRRA